MELLGYLLLYVVILLYAYGITICVYNAVKSKRLILLTSTLFVSALSILSWITLQLRDSRIFDTTAFILISLFLVTTVIAFTLGQIAQESASKNKKRSIQNTTHETDVNLKEN